MLTVENNGLDVSLIAPKCGLQFSPNLYHWLTADRDTAYRSWASRVYRDTAGILWIGMLDRRELIGSKLIAVLCNGAGERTAAWQNIEAVEVTGFWDRYVINGRCAIDPDHNIGFINDSSRWIVSGDSRSCYWCGKHTQALKRWTKEVHCEEWVNLEECRK